MYFSSEVENALVHQKDEINKKLNNATEYNIVTNQTVVANIPLLASVVDNLSFSHELWCAMGYAYKGAELLQRVLDAVRATEPDLPGNAKRKKRELYAIWNRAIKLLRQYDLEAQKALG